MVNTLLRVPPFWPHDVTLWFAMLEAQFGTARITSDKTKFQTAVANITAPYVQLIRDILLAPPETYHNVRRRVPQEGAH